MVRPLKSPKRMLTSTPKTGVKPPREFPRLSTTTTTAAAPSTGSSRRRRSYIYHSKKKASGSKKKGTRKHRFRPGTVALREILFYQRTTRSLIPRLSFSRLIREILGMYNREYRIQSLALEALQESAEAYMIEVLEKANLCCLHARRVTISAPDVKLVRRIRAD